MFIEPKKPDIISHKSNAELEQICKEQWEAIVNLEEETYILGREIDDLKSSLSYQLNILL